MKIFISYAREDQQIAKKLYHDLKNFGLEPWLDIEHLHPGQQWKSVINHVIKTSSYFFALLSSYSVSKKGYVQKELKVALDLFDEFPQTSSYLIPVRIEHCMPLDDKLQEIQWVDLFPSYIKGFKKILSALKVELNEYQILKLEHEEIKEKLLKNSNEVNVHKFQYLDCFFKWNDDNFNEKLDNSSEIKMISIANLPLLISNEDNYKKFISRGGKIKCICLKPNGNAIKMAAMQSFSYEKLVNENVIKEQISYNLNLLKNLSENTTHKDQIQVKLIDYLPPYILTILDQEYSHGTIIVTMNGFGHHYLSRPCFALYRNDFSFNKEKSDSENNWYKFFVDTFENIWNSPECDFHFFTDKKFETTDDYEKWVILALQNQTISESQIVEIFNKIDTFKDDIKKEVAIALKDYWIKKNKWGKKGCSKKQWLKVNKLKKILVEE